MRIVRVSDIIARAVFGDRDREHVIALLLDARHRLVAVHTVSVGLLDSAPVDPREAFKAAFLSNAAAGILAHNHPSGDRGRSRADESIAHRMSTNISKVGQFEHCKIIHPTGVVVLLRCHRDHRLLQRPGRRPSYRRSHQEGARARHRWGRPPKASPHQGREKSSHSGLRVVRHYGFATRWVIRSSVPVTSRWMLARCR